MQGNCQHVDCLCSAALDVQHPLATSSLQHRPLVSNSTYHTTLLHDLLAVRHSTKRSAFMFKTGARPIYGTNGPSQNRHSYPDSSKGMAGAPMYKLFTQTVAISTQSHTDRKHM